jgi:hypothetical protein
LNPVGSRLHRALPSGPFLSVGFTPPAGVSGGNFWADGRPRRVQRPLPAGPFRESIAQGRLLFFQSLQRSGWW